MKMTKFMLPAGCAVAGAVVGLIGGYFIGKKKCKKFYEEEYDKRVYELKREAAMKSEEVEGRKPTEEEAAEIAKDFPTELWSKTFKENNEKRKDYKNLVRQEGYLPDDDGEQVDKKDIFDNEAFEKRNYDEAQKRFDEELSLRAEYCGVSEEALRECDVIIISEEEYYSETHSTEPVEIEWDATYSCLRDIDGEILEPEIILGPDWDMILRRVEDTPDNGTWVYDERLDRYYYILLANPRSNK